MTAPVLWWLPLSHYNEKIAWYLDHRRIPHTRRAIPPFVHAGVAFGLTRGRSSTFPIMQIDGRTLASSSEIVAALEQHWPAHRLIPTEPAERARVLELEAFFDSCAGVDARFTLHHHNASDDRAVDALVASVLPAELADSRAARTAVRTVMRFRIGLGQPGAGERAWRGVLTTLDRIEAELDGGDYLVGDRFTHADLTGAALLYPLVLPVEGPRGIGHVDSLRQLMRSVSDRPGCQWVREIYRRHRGTGAAAHSR